MFRFAELLSRKDSVLKANAADAVSWYQLAALKGHSVAAERLSQMYAIGDRVEQGAELAANWRARADFARSPAEDVAAPIVQSETVTSWGTLTAAHGDASAVVEGDRLRLTFNKLSPPSGSSGEGEPQTSASAGASLNGPRIVQEVTGDFAAAVTFPGPLTWDRTPTVDGVTTSPRWEASVCSFGKTSRTSFVLIASAGFKMTNFNTHVSY